jgi:hypothetical protein
MSQWNDKLMTNAFNNYSKYSISLTDYVIE